MKLPKELIIALVILGIVVLSVAFADSKTVKAGQVSTSAADTKGFALVELFTSEGCSSCPPADALVAKMLEENPQTPIYLMAYHVDYWDRGGWKDAFSDPSLRGRENSGMTLNHVQIVRKLSVEPLSMTNGTQNMALPGDYRAKDWEVIAFVQDKASGAVLAAARCELL